MLEGETLASIAGAGSPDSDGLVPLPVNPSDGSLPSVTFSTPAREVTLVRVKPTGADPGDKVTVSVTFTKPDGITTTQEQVRVFSNPHTRVKYRSIIF